MKIIFLGSGTSYGIPRIGCKCKICKDARRVGSKNKRCRSSLFVNYKNYNILIDTSPDFKNQIIDNDIKHIDVVLYTHDHADHIFGLPDIRSFKKIKCYGQKETIKTIKRSFNYIFNPRHIGGGIPEIELNEAKIKIVFKDFDIFPIQVLHGNTKTYGYKIGNLAYIPDVKSIPLGSLKKLKNLKLLIIDGLRYSPHQTHVNIKESLEIINKIKPQKTFLTHISHEIDHYDIELPSNVKLAYDGLTIHL